MKIPFKNNRRPIRALLFRSAALRLTAAAGLLAFFALPLHAQDVGASLTPNAFMSSATIKNGDPNFTVAYTYSTVWETQKVTSRGLEPGPTLESDPQTAIVGPGKSTVVIAMRPRAKDGWQPTKVTLWKRIEVDWPYRESEQAAIDRRKKQQEQAALDQQKRQQINTDTQMADHPFNTFLGRLKRSGREYGYYPGDPHYGEGYYDQSGRYLGRTDPGSGGNPGRNPGLDRFGKPLSLSNFDKRYPDEPKPDLPAYAGLLPSSLTPVPSSPPAPIVDRSPQTWTDKDGQVYLVEPLPPELQNLTPEQLGYRPDPPFYMPDSDSFDDFLKSNARATDLTPEATADSAWGKMGIDMSPPEQGDLSDEDFESLYDVWQSKNNSTDPFASLYWGMKEEEIRAKIAERKQREKEGMDGGWLNKAMTKLAEKEADRIIAYRKELGMTVPDRETAMREAWSTVTGGGQYMNNEEKKRWNANAERLGITDPVFRYVIDEPPADDKDTKPTEKSPSTNEPTPSNAQEKEANNE